MVYFKKQSQKKNPKNIDQLIKFTFEECYSIPKTLVNNLYKNNIKKIKEIIELDGARLEQEHLKQIKDNEENMEMNIYGKRKIIIKLLQFIMMSNF